VKWIGSILALLAIFLPTYALTQTFDTVILNGRVMDPESNLDAVRTVGIRDGKVVAISSKRLHGKTEIDASELVVAPGFIDSNSHGFDQENYRLIARDGVTTVLELELGPEDSDIDNWYGQRKGKTPLNYGTSISHFVARMAAMEGPKVIDVRGAAAHDPATPAQLIEMEKTLDHGLSRGALGIGFGLQYTPGATREEVVDMFRVAAKHGAPSCVHLRYGSVKEPDTTLNALQEVIAASAITGARLHIEHIGTSALSKGPEILEMVAGAQAHGIDVTENAYPYGAASAGIETVLFDPGWQERLGIDYKDLEWVDTGQRLNQQTFGEHRKTGGTLIIHLMPDEMIEQVIANRDVMIASDGDIEGGHGHPRLAGTFARVLGMYVREKQALTLMEALRKMTFLPAQMLESRVPEMKNKGRLKVGSDADITVFNPRTVIDKSTYEHPALASSGIPFVLVNGVFVVKEERFIEGVNPGQPIRAAHDAAQVDKDAQTKAAADLRVRVEASPKLPFRGVHFAAQTPATGWKSGTVSWVAVDGNGNIYEPQRGDKADPVLVLDSESKVLRSWGEGDYKIPHSIRIDPDAPIPDLVPGPAASNTR
jgi:N-acyl-D-aspartate/D-glutamate deacylase